MLFRSSAPAYAGQDKVNPGSLILSGAMMFEYLGWLEVTDFIVEGVRRAIKRGRVTYDLARQLEGATEVKCSEFARAIVEEIGSL